MVGRETETEKGNKMGGGVSGNLTFGCASLGKDWATLKWKKKTFIWNKAITACGFCPYLLLVIEMCSDSFSPYLSPPQTLKLMSMARLSKSPQSVCDTARSTLFSLHFLSVDGNGIWKGGMLDYFIFPWDKLGNFAAAVQNKTPLCLFYRLLFYGMAPKVFDLP